MISFHGLQQNHSNFAGDISKHVLQTKLLFHYPEKYIYGQFIEHLGRCIYGWICFPLFPV